MTEDTKMILEKLNQMDNRMDSIDQRLDSMDQRFDAMDQRFDSMDSQISSMKSDITDIRMTLENVTNRSIQIIAENHIDLNRKLDDVLRENLNRKMEKIHLYLLEDDVRQIKKKLGMPARPVSWK